MEVPSSVVVESTIDAATKRSAYFKEDTNLRDVTLVCDDSQQIKAHKFILSARSPFFKEILESEKSYDHSFITLIFYPSQSRFSVT